MATAEVRGISPEQQQAYRQITGFFGRTEREFPAAAGQLVNVVGGLVGDQQTTRRELQAGMGNIDVGLALIGDWLKETGAEGFDVKLGIGGGTKKAIGRSKVKFPTASNLIRVAGRVNPELQAQIPPLLSSFSRQIKGGLDIGLSPRQIVGGLVAESVGSRPSANGSANLREALNKPLGGHFEWIRDALGIGDVAARELAGRIQKEAMIGEVKAASPAFLKKDKITGEYELPEGYETVELGSQEERLIPLDKRTGTALIYIENVGFRFTREGGIVHVRPTGFSWPNKSESLYGKALIIPAAGIPISEAGYLQRICVASNNSSNLKMYGGDRDDFVSLDIPDIDESQQGMPLLGLFRIDISIRKGHIKIENFNWKDRISLDPDFIKISVAPASRGEKMAAEKRQEIQRRAAERGAKPAESKTENWEGAVKNLIEDPFAQIAYEQTQSVMAAAAAYSLNAEISNGLVGEEQFIGLVKRIAALSQNMRPKKAQPQLLLQWPEHQRLFLEDEISKTTYEATGSIVAAAAAFSLREEIMAGTIAEEKFVPFVREVATLVQKTRRQIKH